MVAGKEKTKGIAVCLFGAAALVKARSIRFAFSFRTAGRLHRNQYR
jgi:hypothetical protein